MASISYKNAAKRELAVLNNTLRDLKKLELIINHGHITDDQKEHLKLVKKKIEIEWDYNLKFNTIQEALNFERQIEGY